MDFWKLRGCKLAICGQGFTARLGCVIVGSILHKLVAKVLVLCPATVTAWSNCKGWNIIDIIERTVSPAGVAPTGI